MKTERLVSALLVLLVLSMISGCSGCSDEQEASPDLAQSSALELVRRLSDGTQITQEQLAEVLGPLDFRSTSRATRYFEVLEAESPDLSWLASLELRVPKTGATRSELLILRLRQGYAPQKAEVVRSFGGDYTVTHTGSHQVRRTATYLAYASSWGRLSFGFRDDGAALSEVVLAPNR